MKQSFIPHPSSLVFMANIEHEEALESLEDAGEGEQQLQIPSSLPLLPLRDIVIYPFMIVPLCISREKSIRAVDEARGGKRMMLLAYPQDLDKGETAAEELYYIGTVGVIVDMLN